MTLITRGMGAIIKKALGTYKKGKKVKEVSYKNPFSKWHRKNFRQKLEDKEEIVSFDTKKVYVKDKK